ncbi:MAG: DUF4382 domain-containing protein [Bacillota bacterium]
MRRIYLLLAVILLTVVFIGCTQEQGTTKETGTLAFVANGEDFAREGFISKDNWRISFDNVYITLADITGYQANPPYDAYKGGEIKYDKKLGLNKVYTVDIAKGSEPAVVDKVEGVPAGHYNAISWDMVKGTEGIAEGNMLILKGKAEKEGKIVNFNIKLNQELRVRAGEYIGDVRKGIVQQGKEAQLEMTFHLDHIFGDAEAPADDDLNLGALGFEPLAVLAENGKLEVDQPALKALLNKEEYNKLSELLYSLPHVGEGHCFVEKK